MHDEPFHNFRGNRQILCSATDCEGQKFVKNYSKKNSERVRRVWSYKI